MKRGLIHAGFVTTELQQNRTAAFSWYDRVSESGTVTNMLQTSHGMSIPALVPPCFEEPSYGINTSSSRPPFTMCQPHASGPNPVVPSARVLQEVLYSNEMNFPNYMPDMPNNQGLPLPWMSSWHQRQNFPYLGHPHPGKIRDTWIDALARWINLFSVGHKRGSNRHLGLIWRSSKTYQFIWTRNAP